MTYWDKESWCILKHLLKAEGNLKETIDKSVRAKGKFEPEGGNLRNYLTSVENLECAVGHCEEFLSMSYKDNNGEENFYQQMLDSTRLVRQKLINSAGSNVGSLLTCLINIDELINHQVKFMKGEEIEEVELSDGDKTGQR